MIDDHYLIFNIIIFCYVNLSWRLPSPAFKNKKTWMFEVDENITFTNPRLINED